MKGFAGNTSRCLHADVCIRSSFLQAHPVVPVTVHASTAQGGLSCEMLPLCAQTRGGRGHVTGTTLSTSWAWRTSLPRCLPHICIKGLSLSWDPQRHVCSVCLPLSMLLHLIQGLAPLAHAAQACGVGSGVGTYRHTMLLHTWPHEKSLTQQLCTLQCVAYGKHLTTAGWPCIKCDVLHAPAIPPQIDHIHIIKTTELTAASLGPDGSLQSRPAADVLFRTTTQHRASLDAGGGRQVSSEILPSLWCPYMPAWCCDSLSDCGSLSAT